MTPTRAWMTAAVLLLAPAAGAQQRSVRALLPPEVYVNRNQVKIGDMVFDVDRLVTPRGREAKPDDGRVTSRLQAGYWVYRTEPWPGGLLPVSFDFWPERTEISLFRRACAEWAGRASLRCELKITERAVREEEARRRGPGGADRPLAMSSLRPPLPVDGGDGALLLKKGDGCWSTVGKPAWGPAMSLGAGCWEHGVILHELGHAFGAMHEHQRPDAPDYIEILWQNIQPEYHFAYLPLGQESWDPAGATTEYDFESVMHYPRWGFASGSGPTYRLRPGYEAFEDKVGLQNAVSRLDGEGMAKLYGGAKPKTRSDAAFVDGRKPPAVMRPGETARVSATFRNTGETTWSARGGFKLGAENPRDNHVWGGHRVNMRSGERVKPGETKTFTFTVTAPARPGSYDLQVRMLQEGVTWFGAFSPNVRVTVRELEFAALPESAPQATTTSLTGGLEPRPRPTRPPEPRLPVAAEPEQLPLPEPEAAAPRRSLESGYYSF